MKIHGFLAALRPRKHNNKATAHEAEQTCATKRDKVVIPEATVNAVKFTGTSTDLSHRLPFVIHHLGSTAVHVKSSEICRLLTSQTGQLEDGFKGESRTEPKKTYLTFMGSFERPYTIGAALVRKEDASELETIKALACLNNAVFMDPDNFNAQHLRGLAAQRCGFKDYLTSLEHFDALWLKEPEFEVRPNEPHPECHDLNELAASSMPCSTQNSGSKNPA